VTICISLLRGINVSGQKKVDMKGLKKLYESLDIKNVQTYIQSGNVIFEARDTTSVQLKNKIEEKIQLTFGFNVLVIIRTKNEFQKIINNNPFKEKDSTTCYVTFLSEKPTDVPLDDIKKIKDETEEFYISEKEIYLFCPRGYGKTKLSTTYFEKKLKVSATTRNLNTIQTLYTMTTHPF
jgi:uncharacterized protein (DUF1697 family)